MVVVAGILHGQPAYDMFLAGVSLAVAAIPEGLPAIVTIALALGVQRMIKRRPSYGSFHPWRRLAAPQSSVQIKQAP